MASLIYIFGRKFPCYLAARMFHGIGSSLIASSSFSLLANHYKTDKERGEIMSKVNIIKFYYKYYYLYIIIYICQLLIYAFYYRLEVE